MTKIKWQTMWTENNLPPSRFAYRVGLFLKNKKCKTFLDVGCGGGRDSVFFTNKGYQVISLDVFVNRSQQKNLKNSGIEFIKQDVRKIKLKPNSFDVIYAHLSLHYFNNKTTDKIIAGLYNILKPGGYIFIKCKSVKDPLFGKGKKIEENYYNFGHKRHFFTREYMEKKLNVFKIIRVLKTTCVFPHKAAFIEAFAQKLIK